MQRFGARQDGTVMIELRYGRQVTGDLQAAGEREWLVGDGLGGFAMGTAAGLRTRRYHGLLVVAGVGAAAPGGRHLALAAVDPVVVIGDRRWSLGVHEWADGTVAPDGHVRLESFTLRDGLPVWRWSLGDVVVERELALVRGRPAVGIVHRVVRSGAGTVRLELGVLGTWRDIHGERFAGADPAVEAVDGGFVFEGAWRMRGPGFEPAGSWYRGARHRAEAERGLNPVEDLWHCGRFTATLASGQEIGVEAWASGGADGRFADLAEPPPSAAGIVAAVRDRVVTVCRRAGASDDVERHLAVAADQFVVAGPTVVAGYPWFGDWSRDTFTSYEGLLLDTGRFDEGRALIERAAASVSEGMLANTADAGGTEYNTVDGTLWFLHALHRHVERTGDLDLAASLAPTLQSIVKHHEAGTRFGIRVDDDGLLMQGAPGWALTWMDARVDGVPVTGRHGKPVEVNALWINGLAAVRDLFGRIGSDASDLESLLHKARAAFAGRFVRPDGLGLFDVVDPGGPDDAALRPNQLLAVSLPNAPLGPTSAAARSAVAACRSLVTSLGLRSLAAGSDGYTGRHRGGPAERDRAYHQGTVWPWLIGPWVEAAAKVGFDTTGAVDGLEAHLGEWGLGSVSETADGDPPHGATGCPFQAWSVAELLRARRLLARAQRAGAA
jgi:predicted glycogen debranching enzyme